MVLLNLQVGRADVSLKAEEIGLQLTKSVLIPTTSFDVLKLSGHLKWL